MISARVRKAFEMGCADSSADSAALLQALAKVIEAAEFYARDGFDTGDWVMDEGANAKRALQSLDQALKDCGC